MNIKLNITPTFFDIQNFCLYRNGVPRRAGTRSLWSRDGERLYYLFRTRFWERPGNYNKNSYN